ncbi:MAG: carboxypeptidase-like regulatory domain-containing protein [Planctomycetaceae bacterium]|jgi:hypothetical protein|nr:carboxypeptidase-like regulatory domain-containing protein [Planctomycetaceae bacterium]
MKNFSISLTLGIAIAVLFFCGCGKKSNLPDNFPEIAPCEIAVTQDGKPLADALVTLIPQNIATPYAQGCTGITDETGKASLRTYGQIGVPLGKYKVVISKTKDEDGTETTDENGVKIQIGQKVYSYVEKKYTQENSTPYEIDVIQVKRKDVNFLQCEVGKAIREFLRNSGN